MNQNYPLDSRSQSILNELLKNDNYVSVTELSNLLNVSKRSIYYDLCKINDWLISFNLSEIKVERAKGLFLDDQQRKKITELSLDAIPHLYYQFLPMERISIIICALLGSPSVVTIDQLMSYCYVSRNTILADMAIVKTELANYDVKVIAEKRNGYRARGTTLKKRAVFLFYFFSLLPLYHRGVLNFVDYNKTKEFLKRLEVIELELGTRYVEGILLSLSALLSLSNNQEVDVDFKEFDIKNIIETREFLLTKSNFPEYQISEQIYIAIHLLGSRIQVAPNVSISSTKDQELFELTRNVITEFERLACIEFSERNEIERSIFVHLKTSVYRYRYGIQIGNPLTEQVKSNYPELFEITKRVMLYVSKSVGTPISESETAYLTMHFGGHMKSGKLKEVKTKIALYCPDGLSNLKLLHREIEVISNNLEIFPCLTLEELNRLSEFVDIVISSTDIQVKLPMIKINSILSDVDKANLLTQLSKYTTINLNQNFIDSLLSILSKYVAPSNLSQVKNEIISFYRSQTKVGHFLPDVHNPSMIDIMDEKDIIISHKKVAWDESIRISASPLLAKENIDNNYVDNMLKNIIQQGPYIYLEPGLAIAHSRPEDGVKKLGLSIGIFTKGIEFSEDLIANVILVLAPIDHETHLTILREIMAFFGVMTNFVDFIHSKTPKEAYELLKLNIKLDD